MRCDWTTLCYAVAFVVSSTNAFCQSRSDDLPYEDASVVPVSALAPANCSLQDERAPNSGLLLEMLPKLHDRPADIETCAPSAPIGIKKQFASEMSKTEVIEHSDQIQQHLAEAVRHLQALGLSVEVTTIQRLGQQIEGRRPQLLIDQMEMQIKNLQMEVARLKQSNSAPPSIDREVTPTRFMPVPYMERHAELVKALSTNEREKGPHQKVAEQIALALRNGKVRGDITIEFKDATARLSGSTSDSQLIEKATRLASDVAGVINVENHLTVKEKNQKQPDKTETLSNFEIAEQIGQALADANLDAYDIQIRLKNGIATLCGQVHSKAKRDLAVQLTSKVQGVFTVVNSLNFEEE